MDGERVRGGEKGRKRSRRKRQGEERGRGEERGEKWRARGTRGKMENKKGIICPNFITRLRLFKKSLKICHRS